MLVGAFVVFHAGFVAVEGGVAHLAVVVDVDVGFAVGAGDHYAGLLLFGEVEGGDDLEDFDQDVDFEGEDLEELVQAALELFVEVVVAFVEVELVPLVDTVED